MLTVLVNKNLITEFAGGEKLCAGLRGEVKRTTSSSFILKKSVDSI